MTIKSSATYQELRDLSRPPRPTKPSHEWRHHDGIACSAAQDLATESKPPAGALNPPCRCRQVGTSRKPQADKIATHQNKLVVIQQQWCPGDSPVERTCPYGRNPQSANKPKRSLRRNYRTPCVVHFALPCRCADVPDPRTARISSARRTREPLGSIGEYAQNRHQQNTATDFSISTGLLEQPAWRRRLLERSSVDIEKSGAVFCWCLFCTYSPMLPRGSPVSRSCPEHIVLAGIPYTSATHRLTHRSGQLLGARDRWGALSCDSGIL